MITAEQRARLEELRDKYLRIASNMIERGAPLIAEPYTTGADAPPAEPSIDSPPLDEGDWVKCIDPEHSMFGRYGDITKIGLMETVGVCWYHPNDSAICLTGMYLHQIERVAMNYDKRNARHKAEKQAKRTSRLDNIEQRLTELSDALVMASPTGNGPRSSAVLDDLTRKVEAHGEKLGRFDRVGSDALGLLLEKVEALSKPQVEAVQFEAGEHGGTFCHELTHLINRHNMERLSDTPDYILAQFLCRAMHAFDEAARFRDAHRTLPPAPDAQAQEGQR